MIKSITVTNYLGDSIKLELARPELSGFAVLSVSGLGPGKAEINISESALQDGGRHTSSRLPARNILINLMYLWENGIEEARHRSYKYFPLKKPVTLVFETDTREASITGIVESNEPTIFSSVECTSISILCPDPHFYATASGGVKTVVFSGIAPKFEFPFSNESMNESLLEISTIENRVTVNVFYEGDAEIGVTITIHARGAVGDITIANVNTNETMKILDSKIMETTGGVVGLTTDDDLIICTVNRKKSAYLIRNGVRYNVINSIDRNSSWFKLSMGDNAFAYSTAENSGNLQFKIEYQVIYEGV